ncbi:MAG: YdcF family protein [Alphaproteobacteria bacterium]|nr:YdcF family protein [Alphaproteobacteria bacterium]
MAVDDETMPADAIVVLTGGSERLTEGLDLLHRGLSKKLLVSGVYRGVEVAELMRIMRGSPADFDCCVVLGYDADNTRGNAIESAAWMEKEGFRTLRLVTASYHMPRSLFEFRRALPEATIIPHPVFPDRVKHDEWWRWPGTTMLYVREYNKYLLARLRALVDDLLGTGATA